MEHQADHQHDSSESSIREYIKFVFIITAITIVSWLLYVWSESDELADFMRLFMGTFLVTFACFKLLGYRMFVEMFPIYDPIAKRFKSYAYTYPFIEAIVGILFIGGLAPRGRAVIVIVLMGIGAAGIINEVFLRGKKIRCACLGNIIKLPLSTVSLTENLLMVGMAIFMLFGA